MVAVGCCHLRLGRISSQLRFRACSDIDQGGVGGHGCRNQQYGMASARARSHKLIRSRRSTWGLFARSTGRLRGRRCGTGGDAVEYEYKRNQMDRRYGSTGIEVYKERGIARRVCNVRGERIASTITK